VNVLDVALLAVLASAVYGGYRLGLVAGATSWLFLLQGLVLASLASPVLVDAAGGHDPALRLILGAVLFFAAGVGAQFLGRVAGTIFRHHLVPEHLLAADKTAGAVVAPLTVLVIVWLIVLPPMAQVAGWPASLVHHSAVAKGLDAALPDAPDASHALHRLTGPVAQPEVLTALGPAGDSSPPPRTLSLSQAVVSRVAASTVKVEGEACLLDREGSGFAVDRDLVVTNAHVVAGEEKTTVVRPDGVRLPAVVAVFDAERDLALLRVKGLDEEPLALGTAREGSTAAVFGHPGGQDELAVSPASIRQQLVATVHDADLERPARRSVFVLAADLEPGDSGGALVTPAGTVAGVAFAVSSARTGVAYAITTDELRPLLDLDRSGVADTGSCF
jgi:S1-C subfamily serine protease